MDPLFKQILILLGLVLLIIILFVIYVVARVNGA